VFDPICCVLEFNYFLYPILILVVQWSLFEIDFQIMIMIIVVFIIIIYNPLFYDPFPMVFRDNVFQYVHFVLPLQISNFIYFMQIINI
jgi:hypothetical protein